MPYSFVLGYDGKAGGAVVGKLEIRGGIPLYGEIEIQGSKNAVLPILAGCMLGEGACVIENCPRIGDVEDTLEILRGLGCRVKREGNTVTVDASEAQGYKIVSDAAVRIRSSILFLGALLGKMKKAVLPQPGGCAIGERPIDLHVEALEHLGVVFARRIEPRPKGKDAVLIAASGAGLHGGRVRLRLPSVGATENLILAAVIGDGETVIEHAAREPEIDELCTFLNLRGAKIEREPDGSLRICGVKTLLPVTYRMRADRIVTGTYLLAAAATRGCIRIRNFPSGELDALLALLQRAGGRIRAEGTRLGIDMPDRAAAVPYVETAPYPGYPTDLQSPLMAVCATADGESRICEAIFENRFRTAKELEKMGARIAVEGRCASITGVEQLHAAELCAPDLRGGAALVIAALTAGGTTVLSGTEYIERGYEDICRDLRSLGADIFRVEKTKSGS